MNPPRSIFKSKTHAFNVVITLLIGLVGMEGVAEWVKHNAPLVAAIFYLVANLVRWVSHGKVALFPEDEGGLRLPIFLALAFAALLGACQPALIRVNAVAPTRTASPLLLKQAKEPPEMAIVNPAVYHRTSDADLVRALETLTPIPPR